MDWSDEKKILTEQLEILLEMQKRFGEEVIEIASQARLAVHQRWMRELSKGSPPSRPAEVFRHSAYTVTTARSDLLQYDVLDDSESRFAVNIAGCRYADFYKEKGFPEIGYAMHCALDFGEAKAFWPGVTLKRTKTLMQGNEFCDHCYEVSKHKK
ncbi:MAG: L-2-amino-thiazoline-4-carboxylic acid hydrolase [Deltaproteobacteria bacterium]|nr:MAG: L-2-amino-thiazoline-4-carboxylic acid hydrolase [Deltaproteobacteria bacterium]